MSKSIKTPHQYFTMELNAISSSIAQFIIREVKSKRFELPKKPPFPYHNTSIPYNSSSRDYYFSISSDPFHLSIIRKITNEIILQTSSRSPFTFYKNFVQLILFFPTKHIYGLGQRTTSFKLHSGTYTLFNKDNPDMIDYGIGNNNNRYGSQPMYLVKEKSKKYNIGYLHNSFPMDIILGVERKAINYLISGGVLDFTLFLGDENPENVIEAYHMFLGKWTLQSFWSMGFHQSRWGYKNSTMLHSVIESFDKYSIPIDSLWLDIDYMKSSHSCTWEDNVFNSSNFKVLYKNHSIRYVLIAEPTIGYKTKKWVKVGNDLSAFIKDPSNEKPILNRAWSGKSYFIDYFNPNASILSDQCLDFLLEKSNYSGIWLDMNEIATFANGQIDLYENEVPCNEEEYFYYPGNHYFHHKTLCPNALHYDNYTNIEVHNYYSSQQAMVIFDYLKKKFPNEYPFVLSRGNAPGIGRYSFLWSGDNGSNSTWYQLSLSEVFNMNLFGIPMSGTDVCGFSGQTNEFLCAKWYQVGSLYPFFRVHRHHDYSDTEPFAMGDLLRLTATNSIKFRYSILKYYYSLFIMKKNVGTIFRPLFFEFYNDDNTQGEMVINNQFMIGKDILCAPNMNVYNKTDYIAYFPIETEWYDLRSYEIVPLKGYNMIHGNMMMFPPVYLRGGRMIYVNDVKKVVRTFELDNRFMFYMTFAYETDLMYCSEGSIPAIGDYNNKHNVDQCLESDCFIKVKACYDMKKNNIHFDINQGLIHSNDYDGFYITSLYLMFPFKLNLNGLWPKVILQSYNQAPHIINEDTITISKKTNNCIVLNILNPIHICNQDIHYSIDVLLI